MCGIAGFYDIWNDKKTDPSVIGKMLEKIRHRGPDGMKNLEMPGVTFGFARLSFIDLTGGMQPISNEDGNVTVICNGEIFNFKELRDELIAKGHSFKTGTDIEVIVHLYEECGMSFLDRLNGQFAVALYDKAKDTLFLVRDQMGICPLFYSVIDGKLVFASEIKAIMEFPGAPKKLNMKAVDQLMNYPGAVSPETFFDGVRSLKAGHYLTIKRNAEVSDTEYWDLQYDPEEEDKGEEYYVENLRKLIKDAITRRLIADVPIGFYVSGGLDSSVVACFIGKYLLNSMYSFSAEIGDGELDESRFQQMVKECVNSKHYATKITEKEIWENLESVIYHCESGVKESYDTAAFLLSKMVGESPAKAVLTGQGSDEFFSGYAGYMVDLFRNMQKDKMSPEELEVNERLWGDPYFRYERNHPEIRKIHERVYSSAVRGNIDKFSAFAESPVNVNRLKGLSSQKRRSYIDYKLRLSDHLLTEHGDRMFFSHSVEGRHPFLDKELLEFVITIPDKYKLKGVNEKYILKKAGEGIVPDPILKRRKFPFQAPGMSSMIKASKDLPYLSEELIKKQGVFNPDYVREMKEIYMAPDFKLMGAFEIDYLLIVMTVTMLCEKYGLTL